MDTVEDRLRKLEMMSRYHDNMINLFQLTIERTTKHEDNIRFLLESLKNITGILKDI